MINEKNVVNYIMDYEGGYISEEDGIALFKYLKESGMLSGLQGSYQRVYRLLKEKGLV